MEAAGQGVQPNRGGVGIESGKWIAGRRTLADEFEKVIIAADGCELTLLPELGGKISSLSAGGYELLQAPLRPLAVRSPHLAFEESDASGWDECLPTVAACAVQTPAGIVPMQDHGDLWREPWRVTAQEPDAVTIQVVGTTLPLELTRSMMLATTPDGWRLRLLYSLRNVGADRVPWSWSAHPLFACEAGDRIVLPQSVKRVRVEASRGHRLGMPGAWVSWPRGETVNGGYDLSLAAAESSEYAEKLFSERMTDGWCALERARIGLSVTVRWDVATTPYLGLWLCYGGWPEQTRARQMCVAMEPTTAPVDALATIGEWSRWLEPGATTHWPMDVEIERVAATS